METCYKLLIWSIKTESLYCISWLTDTVTQYTSHKDSGYQSQSAVIPRLPLVKCFNHLKGKGEVEEIE